MFLLPGTLAWQLQWHNEQSPAVLTPLSTATEPFENCTRYLSTASSTLSTLLDSAAPQTTKIDSQRPTPWFTDETCSKADLQEIGA